MHGVKVLLSVDYDGGNASEGGLWVAGSASTAAKSSGRRHLAAFGRDYVQHPSAPSRSLLGAAASPLLGAEAYPCTPPPPRTACSSALSSGQFSPGYMALALTQGCFSSRKPPCARRDLLRRQRATPEPACIKEVLRVDCDGSGRARLRDFQGLARYEWRGAHLDGRAGHAADRRVLTHRDSVPACQRGRYNLFSVV